MSSPVLVLVAGDTPAAPLAWALQQAGGHAIAAQGIVAKGQAVPVASSDCILVIPGFEAQLRVLETPARSAAQARAAAGYLFKGALAISEADTLFAVGEAGASGARLTAAIARPRLVAWLARCSALRLTPRAIYVDCALWPAQPGNAHVVRLGDRTLVSAGALGGFTIESDLAPALLGPWLAQLGGAVSTLRLTGWTPDQLRVQNGVTAPAFVSGDGVDPFQVLVRAAATMPHGVPNLADNTSEAGKGARSALAPWLLAAPLAAAIGLTQIGVGVLDGMRDAEAAQVITASAETAFRAARPDVKRITNLRAQVTAAINGARNTSANPVLVVSPSVSDTLVAHPEVRLDEIRQDASDPAVSLRFSSMAPAELDAAVNALRQTSRRVDVGAMQAIEGRSSITISIGAS